MFAILSLIALAEDCDEHTSSFSNYSEACKKTRGCSWKPGFISGGDCIALVVDCGDSSLGAECSKSGSTVTCGVGASCSAKNGFGFCIGDNVCSPMACHKNDTQFTGNVIIEIKADDAEACMGECDLKKECNYWTYNDKCKLLSDQGEVKSQKGAVSGSKICIGSGETRYCTIPDYQAQDYTNENLFRKTEVMTMDGCTDLCRSRIKSDCQHVELHREKDGRLICHELQQKPKKHHLSNMDPNITSADRVCGWKKGDNDAGREVDGEHPNFHKKLGVLVNLAAAKDLERHLREIGSHPGKRLFDSTDEDCYSTDESNRESTKTQEEEKITSISKLASTTIGVSGAYGPVTSSMEHTYGTTQEKSDTVYMKIIEGWSYRKTISIKRKCLRDNGLRLHVVENMKLRLTEMQKLEMPNKTTDEIGWTNYWGYHKRFANDFGTHMVTEVKNGMRVVQITKKSSSSSAMGSSSESSVEASVIYGSGTGSISGGSTREESSLISSTKGKVTLTTLGTPPEIDVDFSDESTIISSMNKASGEQETVVFENLEPLYGVLATLDEFKPLHRIIKKYAYYTEYVHTNNGYKKTLCQCPNNDLNTCQTYDHPPYMFNTREKMCLVTTAPKIMIPRTASTGSAGGSMEELLPHIFVGSMCGDEEKDYSVKAMQLIVDNGEWTPNYFSVYPCNDCSSPHNDDENDAYKTEQCLQKLTGEDFRARNCQWQATPGTSNTNYCIIKPYIPAMNFCCKRTCGFCNPNP